MRKDPRGSFFFWCARSGPTNLDSPISVVSARWGDGITRLQREEDGKELKFVMRKALSQPAERMSSRCNPGFSIVEMMVVIGVVATLALMTVPTFLEKTIRDQVSEALPLADIAKPSLAASWTLAQSFPADNAGAGLPAADKIVSNYISSVSVQDGAIHLTFGNRASNSIKGKFLTIRPAVVEDSPIVPVAWVCGNSAVPGKMAVKGINKTSIAPLFLPLKCR
jgi:type IV pilus assembly protein PilA